MGQVDSHWQLQDGAALARLRRCCAHIVAPMFTSQHTASHSASQSDQSCVSATPRDHREGGVYDVVVV
eukprot:SAG11_NODE_26198_length_348_cov_1.232932_2_plen_67_part_01